MDYSFLELLKEKIIMKQRGFSQGIFQQSSYKKEELGTLRVGANGKSYRYAHAGGAIGAGLMAMGVAQVANHSDQAILTAEAIGTKTLTVTVTAGTAIVENQLQGGEFHINDLTGEGHSYEIESNTSITTATTGVNLTLKRGIKVALDTTTKFNLIPNPFYGSVVSATMTLFPVGVTPIAITSGYYYWAQRTGLASLLNSATTMVAGQQFQLDNDGTTGGGEVGGAANTIPHLGICMYANSTGDRCSVWLTME